MHSQIWEYHRGNWGAISDPLKLESEEDIGKLLERKGYTYEETTGREDDAFAFATYEAGNSAKDETYRFVVILSAAYSSVEMIFVTDFPSYLMLVKELLPVVEAVQRLGIQEPK